MGDTREKLAIYRQTEGRRRKLESWAKQTRKLLDETIIKDLNEVTRRRDMMLPSAIRTAVLDNIDELKKAGIIADVGYTDGPTSTFVTKSALELGHYYFFLVDEDKFIVLEGSDISHREYRVDIKGEDVVRRVGVYNLTHALDKVMDALGMKDTDNDMDGI